MNDSPHSSGQTADSPAQIPPHGWRQVLKRTAKECQADQITFVSAAIAFYLMLGFVPLIGAVVSIYGLIADPDDVQKQTEQLQGVVPGEVLQLVQSQLTRLSQSTTAGWASILAILLALWGGSAAMNALINGLNIAYDETEKRGFLKTKLTSLGLTLVSVLVIVGTAAVAVIAPLLLQFARLPAIAEGLIRWATWPVLLVVASLWMSMLYRFGPCRDRPKWRWVSWGGSFAALLWLLVSAGFSFYVSNLGNYEASYGSLGAIIILLLWFYISGLAALLGAELNAELEHQTVRDSTQGTPQPPGQRGAFVADDVSGDSTKTARPQPPTRSPQPPKPSLNPVNWGVWTGMALLAMLRRLGETGDSSRQPRRSRRRSA